MKIRRCFVSNSSSSSFVVALDKPEDAKIIIKVPVMLDLADGSYMFKTQEDFYAFLKKECMSLEDVPNAYEILMELKNGKIVIFGSFNNDGSIEEIIMCEYGLKCGEINKQIRIIRGGKF